MANITLTNTIAAKKSAGLHLVLDFDGVIVDKPNGKGKLLIMAEKIKALFEGALASGHCISICTNNHSSEVKKSFKALNLNQENFNKIFIIGEKRPHGKNEHILWANEHHGIDKKISPVVLFDDNTENGLFAAKEGYIPVIPIHKIGSGMFSKSVYDTSHFDTFKEILNRPMEVKEIAENRAKAKGYYNTVFSCLKNINGRNIA